MDQPLYCRNFYSPGVNGPGGFADELVARADKCFVIEGLDPMVVVMTELLACCCRNCCAHESDRVPISPYDVFSRECKHRSDAYRRYGHRRHHAGAVQGRDICRVEFTQQQGSGRGLRPAGPFGIS